MITLTTASDTLLRKLECGDLKLANSVLSPHSFSLGINTHNAELTGLVKMARNLR